MFNDPARVCLNNPREHVMGSPLSRRQHTTLVPRTQLPPARREDFFENKGFVDTLGENSKPSPRFRKYSRRPRGPSTKASLQGVSSIDNRYTLYYKHSITQNIGRVHRFGAVPSNYFTSRCLFPRVSLPRTGPFPGHHRPTQRGIPRRQ